VGSLLLTNSDFRLFLSDLGVVTREIFKDTADALSKVAEETSEKLEPSQEEQLAVKEPGKDAALASSHDDLEDGVTEVSQVLGEGVVKVAEEAKESVVAKATGDEKETLIKRLQQAIVKLRRRRDYSDSVSTLALLFQRYALVYSRALGEAVDLAEEDVHENKALDRALENFWLLLSSFGDPKEWNKLKQQFHRLLEHRKDPEFEDLMINLGQSIQQLLTDPEFFDHAGDRIRDLRSQSQKSNGAPVIRNDVETFLDQLKTTFATVLRDADIARLISTGGRILSILSPANDYVNKDLLTDALNVFIPLAINLIQYIPIPRLEVSIPELDLLLENLVIEPGKTVNHTSFFPYRFRASTHTDLEIRKARFRTSSSTSTLVTLQFDGLSVRADEIGFLLRAHSGLFRLADAGIASFALDERGMDIHIDVEVGKSRLEKILSLSAVRVKVHKLNFNLRQSRFSWLSWIVKPLLRPLLRKVLEKQLASSIADFLHAANRELLFARERLRATRVADPDDLLTFVKAVAARLTPEDNPDIYARVGVDEPGEGIFKGLYAPGSLVKVWHDEADRAGERVDDLGQARGWKNDIFDMHVMAMT
jgi:hypothetical protein